MWAVVCLDTSTTQLQKCPTAAVRHSLFFIFLIIDWWWFVPLVTYLSVGHITISWKGRGGIDVRSISQTIMVMNGAIPVLQPWWMTNNTCVLLFNIKCQAHVCVCVYICRGQIVKLFVIIWVLLFIVHTHVRTATRTFTHILPATHWASAVLSCFIALSLSLPPSLVTQDRDPSCHRHRYE